MNTTGRRELLRRLGEQLDRGTGFNLANISRVLGATDPRYGPPTWKTDEWERYASAVERVSQTPVTTRREEGGALVVVQADGSPLTEEYLADARVIVAYSPQVVAEVEHLRHLVAAADLVLSEGEKDVMALVVAGLELLAVDPCGHDPGEELDRHCPSCRMRSALRAMGHQGSTPP